MNQSDLRKLLTLALPVTLQAALFAATGMIDVLMVGHLGDVAVAAVGFGAKINHVVFVVTIGVCMGVSALISQYWVNRQWQRIRQAQLYAIALGGLLIAPFFGLLLIAPELIAATASTEQEVIDIAAEYLWITSWTYLFALVALVWEHGLRATGHPLVPLTIACLCFIINIALNYILIYGHFGFDPMGVKGAAIATVIARIAHLVFTALYIYSHTNRLLLRRIDISRALVSKGFGRFCKITMPIVGNVTVWVLGTLCYHIISGHLDTQALTAVSLMAPLETLLAAVYIGLFNACAILVGYKLGRNEFEDAARTGIGITVGAVGSALAVGLALWFLSDWTAALLAPDSSETVNILSGIIAIFAVGFWLRVSNMLMFNGILRAGGDNAFCLKLEILCMWVIEIPLALALAFYFKLPFIYVFGVFLISESIKALLAARRVKSGIWKVNLTKNTTTHKKTVAQEKPEIA